MIITLILTAINNISYADVLKGENAYNVFRINDYKNIKYKIDESNTNKYRNHTDAWKNAINSFEIAFSCKIAEKCRKIRTAF